MEEDRLGYVKDRIDKIQEVLDDLWGRAKADDTVTQDERDILENVQDNIKNYQKLARKLTEDDGAISDEDLEKLYIFEKQIVQSASSQALSDGEITGEEGDLLQLLLDFFENINEE